MQKFNSKWTIDRTKYMTEDEVEGLRDVGEKKAREDLRSGRTTWPRFWMAMDLATLAGMRVSEIAALKVENLFLAETEPRLRVTGKGQRSRDVFIPENLKRHILEYLNWKRLVNEPTSPGAYLLNSSHKKPYCTRTLQYAFKMCAKIAGLPSYYSIHACRHSYGTILYKHTKSLRLVQKQLGHSSITTTTVYADVSAQEAVAAVNISFAAGCLPTSPTEQHPL